jgi:hypothetical protein
MSNKIFVAQLDYCWTRLHQVNYSIDRDLRTLSFCSNLDIAVNLERTAWTGNCHVLYAGG